MLEARTCVLVLTELACRCSSSTVSYATASHNMFVPPSLPPPLPPSLPLPTQVLYRVLRAVHVLYQPPEPPRGARGGPQHQQQSQHRGECTWGGRTTEPAVDRILEVSMSSGEC